jgi:hypothetical protein
VRGKAGQRVVHIGIEVVLITDLVGFFKDFPQQPAPGGLVVVLQYFQQRQNEDEDASARSRSPPPEQPRP